MHAAEAVGYKEIVPAFLDPNLKLEDIPHGVSFASAATGYDDFTANISVKLYLLHHISIKAQSIYRERECVIFFSLFFNCFNFFGLMESAECSACFQTDRIFHALQDPLEKIGG